MPAESLEPKLFDLEEGRFRYSVWRNLSIGVWAAQADLDAATRVVQLGMHMREQHPSGHSSVVFVLAGAPAPTAEAQAVLARLFDPRNDLSCTAIVVEGDGFWASGIRMAITGVHLAEPSSRVKLRINESIDQVLDWLPAAHYESTGVEITRAQLNRLLASARAAGANRREAESGAAPRKP